MPAAKEERMKTCEFKSPARLARDYYFRSFSTSIMAGDGLDGLDAGDGLDAALTDMLNGEDAMDALGAIDDDAVRALLTCSQSDNMVPAFSPKLSDYSLDARIAVEDADPGAAPGGLLMLRPGVLRPTPQVWRYTFPGGIKKTHILLGLLEQANKGAMTPTLAHMLRDVDEELSQGKKAVLFDKHVKDYVVLLPIHPPTGVPMGDELFDRSMCFSFGMIGQLVVMCYVPSSGPHAGRSVAYAMGVTVDRAYVNSQDLEMRVRFEEDAPEDAHGNDKAPLLLPVRVLGLVRTPNGAVSTWPADDTMTEGSDDLPPELHVVRPSPVTAAMLRNMVCLDDAAGEMAYALSHAIAGSKTSMDLSCTKRSNARTPNACLKAVLRTAASQARVRFQT